MGVEVHQRERFSLELSEASSLGQGLRLVRLIIDREKQGRPLLGVSQLAAELEMDQSRVSRLTQELCELTILERVERGPFRAGPAFFQLAASLNVGWIGQAKSELALFVSEFGLRARLSVRDGVRVVLLRTSSNDAVPGSFVKPGMVTPVWCTGSGRALLWDHKATEVAELLQGVDFIGVGGPRAAHAVSEVCELMEHDRPQGFIRAAEEFEHDVHELAVPVRDPGGRVSAALSVLGSRAAVELRTEEIADALHSAARRLAAVGADGTGVS